MLLKQEREFNMKLKFGLINAKVYIEDFINNEEVQSDTDQTVDCKNW